jgi:hypothetical protein
MLSGGRSAAANGYLGCRVKLPFYKSPSHVPGGSDIAIRAHNCTNIDLLSQSDMCKTLLFILYLYIVIMLTVTLPPREAIGSRIPG